MYDRSLTVWVKVGNDVDDEMHLNNDNDMEDRWDTSHLDWKIYDMDFPVDKGWEGYWRIRCATKLNWVWLGMELFTRRNLSENKGGRNAQPVLFPKRERPIDVNPKLQNLPRTLCSFPTQINYSKTWMSSSFTCSHAHNSRISHFEIPNDSELDANTRTKTPQQRWKAKWQRAQCK